jgi:2'-5' RNA ligase
MRRTGTIGNDNRGSGITSKPRRLRLFFAAWPPCHTAQALHSWALKAADTDGARVLPAANLHLTLAFLGETAAARVAAAIDAARRVEFEAHAIEIEHVRYSARSRIVWAAPAKTPAPLAALAAGLAAELAAVGFEFEERAFAAHVTLIRNAHRPRPLPPLPELGWEITEFVLARSTLTETGSQYAVIERFGA